MQSTVGPINKSIDPVEGLPPLRQIVANHELYGRRSLGQHFIMDIELTRRIARAAGDLTQGTTIEIGPGPGGLTRALLLEGANNVIAIERDSRCLEALKSLVEASCHRLRLIHGNALVQKITDLGDNPRRIVANLPYNIAMPLLMNWLDNANAFKQLTLMFQREVADRLVARPGNKTYGRPSVIVQWHCAVKRLFDVPASAFVPPPKVLSSVVLFTPYESPLYPANKEALNLVTTVAFSQRRKMLRSALKVLPVDTAKLLERAGIEPSTRAETLDIQQFASLARAFTDLREDPL